MLHLCGKSPYKNTTALLEAWKIHPEWPKLTCIGRKHILGKASASASNIELITDFLSEDDLETLMNRNPIHICPSRFEGFEHYMNEARSTGAVVLYGDARPMNEFFEDGVNGIALGGKVRKEKRKGIQIDSYTPSLNDFEKGLRRLLGMSSPERWEMGQQARQAYLRDKGDFTYRWKKFVQSNYMQEPLNHKIT